MQGKCFLIYVKRLLERELRISSFYCYFLKNKIERRDDLSWKVDILDCEVEKGVRGLRISFEGVFHQEFQILVWHCCNFSWILTAIFWWFSNSDLILVRDTFNHYICSRLIVEWVFLCLGLRDQRVSCSCFKEEKFCILFSIENTSSERQLL